MIARSNIARLALAFGLVAFLLLGTFGLSHAGMTTGMDGQMTDCPFSPGVAICNMTPFEMIATSQNLLTALPQQKDALSLLTLLIATALALTIFWRPLVPPSPTSSRVFRPRREYIPFHNPLQELFSDGILNPKIF